MRVYPIKFGENRKRCRLANFAVALKGITFNPEKLKNIKYISLLKHPIPLRHCALSSILSVGILINKFCGELCFFKYSLMILFASVFVRTRPVAEGGPFWLEIPMSGGGLGGMFLASNVTHVAVRSGWNSPYGSMGPGGHIRYLDLVMGGHARCSMGPKQSLDRVFFSLKSTCMMGVQRHVLFL